MWSSIVGSPPSSSTASLVMCLLIFRSSLSWVWPALVTNIYAQPTLPPHRIVYICIFVIGWTENQWRTFRMYEEMWTSDNTNHTSSCLPPLSFAIGPMGAPQKRERNNSLFQWFLKWSAELSSHWSAKWSLKFLICLASLWNCYISYAF